MLIYALKRLIRKKKWRMMNKNNYTTYNQIYGDISKIHIGKNSYGDIYVSSPNTDNELYIGNYCSIAGEVRFLLGADHPINYVSTYPFKTNIIKNGVDAISKGNIIVDDDVWIGQGAIILSGVHIGQGAVIAAGSIVTRDIPSYAIAGGIPAKVIKYRFSQDIISELMKVDYSKLTDDMNKEHVDDLYADLQNINQLEWLPKKSI